MGIILQYYNRLALRSFDQLKHIKCWKLIVALDRNFSLSKGGKNSGQSIIEEVLAQPLILTR